MVECENHAGGGEVGLIIVPNSVADAINAKLDLALSEFPEATTDREHIYNLLLSYFEENGEIPEFILTKKQAEK
jgi:hypothetical protein